METYPPKEWYRRRILGGVGVIPEALAGMIPAGAAARSPVLASAKGGFVWLASQFPPIPYHRQLEGFNQERARIWDRYDPLRGFAAAVEFPGRVLGQGVEVIFGTPRQGNVILAPSFWGMDP